MRAAALVLALAGCGEPVDPLGELRVARTTWAPADEAAPNATLVAGHALGERLVLELLDGATFASPPGPFGMRLIVLPTGESASLELRGEGPLEVELEVTGTADLRTGLGGPSDLPWTAEIDGALTLGATSDPLGLHLALGADPEDLAVRVALDGIEGAAADVAAGTAAGAIETALRQPLASGALAATIPPGPATPRDLRPRGHGSGLVVELVLPAIDGAAAPAPATDPGDGFVVDVPLETVLGVARAIASTQALTGPAVFEPEGIAVGAGGSLVVEGRVHRTARRERWRRYRGDVVLGIADGHLTASLHDLELVDARRWGGGPAAAIAEASAPTRLAAIAEQIETERAFPLGSKRQLRVAVERLETTDTLLRVFGTARVEPRPEAE